jgi:hypothetical protein
MGQEILSMRTDEIKYLQVIRKVLEGQIKQTDGAKAVGISDRQLRRLIRRVELEGDVGVIHKARGKMSHRRLSDKLRQKVLGLYRSLYEGFGPTLASEKLKERNNVKVSKETLRQWLSVEGLWQVRAKRRRCFQWRERKAYCGQMVQMDGSHHDWLQGRGPWLVLMGFIDDATSRVFARFYGYEGTMPAMDGLRRYILRYGIPSSIYSDRHTTYKSPKYEQWQAQTLGFDTNLTAFGKSVEQLGIEMIYAHTPQAKGRIERLFKTLQDRLVKELGLANAKTLEEANKVLEVFLVQFNRQFNIPAKESGDLHRALSKGMNLQEVFSVKTERSLRNDNTIAHDKKWYQVFTLTRFKQVTVQEMLDGQINILGNGNRLKFKEIKQPPKQVYVPRARKTSRRVTPASNHPWQRSFKTKLKSKNRTFLLC